MSSLRSAIISIVVLGIIAVVAYFLLATRTQAPQEAVAPQQQEENTEQDSSNNEGDEQAPNEEENTQPAIVTAVINDEGFASATIIARKGDRIVFVNRGTSAHWPASAVHPTHEVYPELDAKAPVAPGQSWTFTATNVGEWRIHDHLNPSETATVIITE